MATRTQQMDILEDLYDTIAGNDRYCSVDDFQQRHTTDDFCIDYDFNIIDLGNGYGIRVFKFE